MNLKSISENQRKIRTGDTFVRLTDREIMLEAVEYIKEGVGIQYATIVEVRQARFPGLMFGVTDEGHETMKAKADRLEKLRNRT